MEKYKDYLSKEIEALMNPKYELEWDCNGLFKIDKDFFLNGGLRMF